METQRDDISNLIQPENAGLLVIDVQEKLWRHINDNKNVLKRMEQAIAVAGHLDMPILVAEQYVRGLGPTIPEIKAALEAADATSPIEKVSFSCFEEPAFVTSFDASGIDTLAIIGIEAHVCVMQTALQALDRGIDVFSLLSKTPKIEECTC